MRTGATSPGGREEVAMPANAEADGEAAGTSPGGAANGDVPENNEQIVAAMTRVLDSWRARIDELRVQMDLAKLDVRGQASSQLEVAQNACLAAYAKLREAGRDATENTCTLRQGVEKLVQDVKAAIEAAQSVLAEVDPQRGRSAWPDPSCDRRWRRCRGSTSSRARFSSHRTT